LIVQTLYPPVLRRALANGDIGDWQIPAKELRPLRRLIDSSNGTVPWDDFQDDTDRRLAELVAAKVRPSGRRRGARSNGRARSAAASSRSRRPSGTARKGRRAA
jgi:non-homologous end joining protein Ku